MAVLYSDKWEINDIEAVLFDKDGTFIDSDKYWGKLGEMRINEILHHFSLPIELFDNFAKVIGYLPNTGKLTPNGPLAVLSRDEVISLVTAELVNNNNVKTDSIEIAEIFNRVHDEFKKNMFKYINLLDGALNLFQTLKHHNVKMAVVTSDSYSHTVETLKYLQIEEYFDLVVGHDTMSYPKKTGIPAFYALNQMNVLPCKACVFGDAPMDAYMAQNSFVKACVLVTTGQVPKDELRALSPYVINSLNEVKVK